MPETLTERVGYLGAVFLALGILVIASLININYGNKQTEIFGRLVALTETEQIASEEYDVSADGEKFRKRLLELEIVHSQIMAAEVQNTQSAKNRLTVLVLSVAAILLTYGGLKLAPIVISKVIRIRAKRK